MRDFDDEIRDLREKTEQSRFALLRTELQTCVITFERARFELALGNIHEARKECAAAERGTQVIERFLAGAPGPMDDIEAKLANLKGLLESLRLELERLPG